MARGNLNADMWGEGLKLEEQVQRSLGENVSGVSEEPQGDRVEEQSGERETCLFASLLSSYHTVKLFAIVTFNYLLSKLIKLDSRTFRGKTNSD